MAQTVKYLLFFCFSIGLLGYLPNVSASKVYPIVTVLCDKKANVLKIKNEAKWDEDGKNFAYSPEDGIYNPWDWAEIYPHGSRTLVRERKQISITCKLARATYQVIMRPKIFNPNYLGKCGDRLSARVTILKGDVVILEDKEFEKFCHGNAKIVRGVKVFDKTGKLKIYEVPKHKFY